MNRIKRLFLSLAIIGAGATGAQAADDVMVVFDGSNSMWGQIDGVAKIEIAREAMDNLMGDWVADTNLGLMAYGHRREGDCTDIETIIQPGPADAGALMAEINAISPRGKTPLTSAIEQAAEVLAYRDNPATVVVISDGIESCERDPCALADELERGGIGFTAHVVGFGLSNEEEQQSLACIAERTGGKFLPANDADQLGAALSEVSTAVAEPEPAPEPEPEPEPEPAPQVALSAPETVVAGSIFEVDWSPVIAERDYITIVPTGADEGTHTDYVRAGGDDRSLIAPADPGLYEVRYVLDESDSTAAASPIEVTEPEVSVSAPETALAGSDITVEWSNVINNRDFITIVPMGADEGDHTDYVRAGSDDRTIKAPGDPGLYEVRYVLNEGDRTLASTPIEITEPEVTVSAPETALAGSDIDVNWSTPVDERDYITIVPMGAEEGAYTDYVRAGGDDRTIKAPADPGLYEVRYVLNEGDRTLASSPIEVTEPEVSVSAPETGLAASRIEVDWSSPVDDRDYITIVPMGADAGEYTDYIRAGSDDRTLATPPEPGLYEVRYVLNQGDRTMAMVPIELTAPQTTISATETVRAGTEIDIEWSGDTPDPRDYITVVTAGVEEGAYEDYVRASNGSPVTLAAPETPGIYEVRYVLTRNDATLASATVEVVAEDATLNTGGSLEAPDTAAPGEVVGVNWSTESEGSLRIALARADQADFTWIEAKPTDNEPPLSFTMPEQAGFYEFRLLDISNQAVLSRATISVE
jgi:Ca-activated chloride channel family protein